MTGRPRSAHIDDAVLGAVVAELNEAGYGRLTIESVARRAGTTKPAVYRRWPSRQQLVLAALTRRRPERRVPNSGCVVCDLVEGVGVFLDAHDGLPPDVLGSLLADCTDRPALRVQFMNTVFEPARFVLGEVVDRALARGDLRPDLDRDLAVDLLGALVHYRVLYGHARADGEAVEAAVVTLLRGVAGDFPALAGRRTDHRHSGLTT
jgi:AcrR family transcriptional regulator